MKKSLGVVVVLLIIVGAIFGLNVYEQQQEIDAIPDAQVSEVVSEEVPLETPSSETAVADDQDNDEAATEEASAQSAPESEGGFQITLTSTPAGLTQETESDVIVDLDQTFLTFEGYAPGKSHTGTFETFEATISFDEVKTVTGGTLLVEAASVKSDSAGLDDHLKNEDFFNVDTYPTIEYTLNNVIFNSGSGEASAQGTLTFHGVTQEITAPVTILPNGFNSKFNISMEQFGISYTGVNDEVTIEVQVVLQ